MVRADVEPANIVTHDHEDVGFLSLLGGGRNARHCRGGTQHDKSAPDCSEPTHDCFSRCWLPKPGAAAFAPPPPCGRGDWSKRPGCAMRFRQSCPELTNAFAIAPLGRSDLLLD